MEKQRWTKLATQVNQIKSDSEKMIQYQVGVIEHCDNLLLEVSDIIQRVEMSCWHHHILQSFESFIKG